MAADTVEIRFEAPSLDLAVLAMRWPMPTNAADKGRSAE